MTWWLPTLLINFANSLSLMPLLSSINSLISSWGWLVIYLDRAFTMLGLTKTPLRLRDPFFIFLNKGSGNFPFKSLKNALLGLSWAFGFFCSVKNLVYSKVSWHSFSLGTSLLMITTGFISSFFSSLFSSIVYEFWPVYSSSYSSSGMLYSLPGASSS